MAYRRTKLVSAFLVVAGIAGYGLYGVSAQVGAPVLAQSPMNVTSVTPPAFIMAMDDSRSMRYQAVFPTTESPGAGGGGGACWSSTSSSSSSTSWSFFSGPGQLRQTRTNSNGTCGYMYYMTSVRDLTNNAIPPIDAFGFARSPAYSYSYYDPGTLYTPWAKGDGTFYPDSNPSNPKLEPHDGSGVGFSLTSNVFDKNARSRFRAFTGMRLPADMKYRLTGGNCGGLQGNSDRTVGAGGHTMTASCELYIEYYPATFYLPTNALPEIPGYPNAYAGMSGTEIQDACGTGCSLWKFTIPAGNTVAARNYANWFTYYNNRHKAAVAAASHALADVNNMRVGYFTINNRNTVTMYDMDDVTQKKALFGSNTSSPGSSTLLGLVSDGNGTPNANAIDFMGTQFKRTGDGAPIISACQKNAGMLFTDGATNNQSVSASAMNLGAPFDPTASNTIAAIASKYYFNNNSTNGQIGSAGNSPLRTDLPGGKVPVPEGCKTAAVGSTEWKRLDCQSNLHMNLYAITLGMRGVEFDPTANPKQDPFVDSIAWPSSRPANDSIGTVDDLWHATVNTRGEFINANTSSEITTAMRRILAAVSAGKSPAGTVAVSGARIGTGSITVAPSYEVRNNGTDWFGQLTADAVSSDPLTGAVSFSKVWEASERLAAQGANGRTIKFGKTAASVVPTVAEFNASNVTLADLCTSGRCTAAELTALGSGMNATRAIAYLRGSRTDEGVLRTRSTVLGDIVNSSPVMVASTDDYGYQSFGGTMATSYKAFLDAKKTAGRSLVLVGANDGMFHVFDGRSSSPPGGNEVFAYIPATALGYMGDLLYPYDPDDKDDQKFRHRYLVDGPVTVSDIYNGTAWKTIAVGTSGAGGRSVFALDITNPDSPTVLWEINNLITGNTTISNNIGHVLGKPVIVPVKTGLGAVSWKVVFGNGYNSAAQTASLFVVDAWTGSAAVISAAEATPPEPYNGLGNVVVIDTKRDSGGTTVPGRDGYADTAYAADQHGAIWKFDLLAGTAGAEPLFIAKDAGGNRQAITGGITTAAGPGGSVMVYFGSGRFSFVGDPDILSTQTLYGIQDRGVPVANRDALQQQTVGSVTSSFRATSTTALGAGKLGWYLDLPTRQRSVGYPRIESGVVFFPVYEPSDNSNTDNCAVNGANWLYGLNALSGAAALTKVRMGSPTGNQPGSTTGAVELATGGSAPVKDVAVMTTPRVAPLEAGASQADIDAAIAARCSMVVHVAGAPPMYLPRPCGRQSWRQVR
ncbi:pilus assembly protein [Pseudoxanthomonas koreensis]|uniref:pilus assembly protein n=1 Tax=Pseudoxanthomonas koreensis TaxID=266061 RepID=UPI0035A6D83D